MVIAKRARSNEQKDERRKEILVAAAALLKERPFHRISTADIAHLAGMAKGTVFLYFRTKEEIFFQILTREFESWFETMDNLFADLCRPGKKPVQDDIPNVLRRVLALHPLFPQLSAILHIVLEQNIGYKEARAFKKMVKERLDRSGALLEDCLPYLEPGQGVTLLLWMYALIIGFTHMAVPAPVVRKIYQREPDLQHMQIDFSDQFLEALNAILDGWKARNVRRRRTA